MAILIPSKNIYQKQNQKVVKNAIKSVFVDKKIPCVDKKIKTNVFSKEQWFNTSTTRENNYGKPVYNYATSSSPGIIGQASYALAFSVSKVKMGSVLVPSFSFPKELKNGKIDKVYTGYDEEGNTNIQVSIVYDVLEEDVSQTITAVNQAWPTTSGQQDLTAGIATFGEIVSNSQKFSESAYNAVPSDLFYRKNGTAFIKFENVVYASNTVANSSISTDVGAYDDISSITPSYDDISKNYVFSTFWVVSSFQTLKMSASYHSSGVAALLPSRTQVLTGKRITYTPKKMELTIYGDTFEIEFNEEKMSFGFGEPSLNIDDNELFQSSSFVKEGMVDNDAVSNFSQKIIENYKDGKETATIRCSVSDYYDESGNKVIDISTNKLSFDIGNIVIPFVYDANGNNVPMSNYKDAMPKKFRIVRLKFIYDGAVWQELTLQEV